jgi:hypothetical protein
MLRTFLDHFHDAVEAEHESVLRFWIGVLGDEGRSLTWEHLTALRTTLTGAFRGLLRERITPVKTVFVVILATVVVLALLGLRVWLYPEVLSAPHGGGDAVTSVAGMTLLVLTYAIVTLSLLRARLGSSIPQRSAALQRAALLGALVGGGVLCAIAVDTLGNPDSPVSLGVWLIVVLTAPIGWGLAGLTATRGGGPWRLGLVAALWSGMVSAIVGALGEVTSTLVALPRLVERQLSNPDYLYWHQPDVQSYAIASSLALSMAGLILAPVAASLVGGMGCWLGKVGNLEVTA